MNASGGSNYRWIFAGVLTGAGLHAFALAVVLAGAGHGWGSPLRASCAAFFLGPLTLLACCSTHRSWVRVMCAALLAAGLGCDVLLFALTRSEGIEYVSKTWAKFPEGVIGWGVVWVFMRACQVGALWSVLRSAPRS